MAEPSTNRIRIVRVIARMNVGGPAQIITTLQRGLDADRFDQVLLSGEVDEGEADWMELRAPDLPVTRVPGLGRSVRALGDVRALVFLTRTLRRLRPDVVETHTAKAGVLGRLAAVAARAPIRVHVFHGHLLYGYFPRWTTKAVALTEKIFAWRTTSLVAVGAQVRDDLLAAGVGRPEQFSVVAPGVPGAPVIDRDEARSRLGVPTDRPVVVFAGRLTAVKRADRFVELARAVQDRGHEATFVVVGDGPLRAELEMLANSIGAPVHFAGWRSDMDTVYATADLVVLTSDNEGMPLVLIEAAAHGVPAISTDVGAIQQIIEHEHTGLLVAAGDDNGLCDATCTLLTDDILRNRLAEEAQARAETSLSDQLLVRQLDDLYTALVSRRRSTTTT